MAIGFAGMLLSAWLFDRAFVHYPPSETDSGDKPQSVPWHTVLLRQIVGVVMLLIVLAILYNTNLLVADILLLAACFGFAVSSYRVRLKPLLESGIQQTQFMLLVIALCLWVLPMVWFVHLHLAQSYGAL